VPRGRGARRHAQEAVATLLDILEGPGRDVSIAVSALQALAACAAVQGVVAAAVADAGPRERLVRCLLNCVASGSWEAADTAWELLRQWLQAHVRGPGTPSASAGAAPDALRRFPQYSCFVDIQPHLPGLHALAARILEHETALSDALDSLEPYVRAAVLDFLAVRAAARGWRVRRDFAFLS